MLQALADPTRLAVFECIRGCGGAAVYDSVTGLCDSGSPKAVAMCDVRCKIPCAPSTLSHHLATLRSAGLVESAKIGREVYAKVRPEAIQTLSSFIDPHRDRLTEDPLEKKHE